MTSSADLEAWAYELRELAKIGLREASVSRRFRVLAQCPLLASLPQVVAAGSDVDARFEYLVQALTDAVDDLAGTGAQPLSSERAREVVALRTLFGLTETTRRRSWTARQAAAADALHVSSHHFRHEPQSRLLQVLADRVFKQAQVAPVESLAASGLVVVTSASESEAVLFDRLRIERPTQADLLDFSTATSRPLIGALRDGGARIRLLVADPGLSAPGWQRARHEESLRALYDDFRDDECVTIRCYVTPPSLRGRRFARTVAVGWYTTRDNKLLEAADAGAAEVWGHDNALIVASTDDEHGARLANWFGREFERLWLHRWTTDDFGPSDQAFRA